MSDPAPALLVLSPHLDDAVLSCGGEIAETSARGGPVLVATVFTADDPPTDLTPLAEQIHDLFGLPPGAVSARRRDEDLAAAAELGAHCSHLGFAEALYRRGAGAHLYTTAAALFGEVSPLDDPLVEAIAARLSTLPRPARILCPLGVGRHVDHVVVRRAAERAYGDRVVYYEDYPYVERWGALRRLLKPRSGWSGATAPVSAEALARKCAAVACYRSQVPSLFQTGARMEKRVRAFVGKRRGERRWVHRAV